MDEYNKCLIDNKIKINLIDYVKDVNEKYHNIDISFIDDFMNYINVNDYVIHQSMLEKYGVLTIFDKNKSKNDSFKVKRLLIKYGFKEDIDYMLAAHLGGQHIGYYLKPKTFKICLMRSQKTQKYANYYLLLEECVKYYNDLQFERSKIYITKFKKLVKENKKEIEIKDCKIDKLIEQNKELIKRSDKQINLMTIMHDKIDKLTKSVNDVVEDMSIRNRDNKDDSLAILKYEKNGYNYHIIRGQQLYVKRLMQKLDSEHGNVEVAHIEYEPNARTFWNHAKVSLDIKCKGVHFNLDNCTEEELITKLSNISKDRSNSKLL